MGKLDSRQPTPITILGLLPHSQRPSGCPWKPDWSPQPAERTRTYMNRSKAEAGRHTRWWLGWHFINIVSAEFFSSQNKLFPWSPLWLPRPQEKPIWIQIADFPLSFHALLQWPGARLEALDSPTDTTDHRYSQSLPSPRMHANSFPKGHLRIASSLHKTTELENWYIGFMAARPAVLSNTRKQEILAKLQSSFAFSLGSTELGSFQLLRTGSISTTLSALPCYSTCCCCVWKVATVLFLLSIFSAKLGHGGDTTKVLQATVVSQNFVRTPTYSRHSINIARHMNKWETAAGKSQSLVLFACFELVCPCACLVLLLFKKWYYTAKASLKPTVYPR